MTIKLRRILALFVCLLLIVNVILISSGSTSKNFTFTGLIETMQNAPSVSPVFVNEVGYILGDWGMFNFLRDFINVFLEIFNFLLTIINSLWQVLNQVIYYCRTLFI